MHSPQSSALCPGRYTTFVSIQYPAAPGAFAPSFARLRYISRILDVSETPGGGFAIVLLCPSLRSRSLLMRCHVVPSARSFSRCAWKAASFSLQMTTSVSVAEDLARCDSLVLGNGLLLLRVVVLVEAVSLSLGFRDGFTLLPFCSRIPRSNLVRLLQTPLSV